mmetsp:Transcript_46370/g.135060  ORF Transcript_46370/g.135060 Transcript_46370/m.135060 type:complete len:201 (-) Transcript_46370:272-874(-)
MFAQTSMHAPIIAVIAASGILAPRSNCEMSRTSFHVIQHMKATVILRVSDTSCAGMTRNACGECMDKKAVSSYTLTRSRVYEREYTTTIVLECFKLLAKSLNALRFKPSACWMQHVSRKTRRPRHRTPRSLSSQAQFEYGNTRCQLSSMTQYTTMEAVMQYGPLSCSHPACVMWYVGKKSKHSITNKAAHTNAEVAKATL